MMHERTSSFHCSVKAKLLLCGEHIALCGGWAAGVVVPESLTLDFAEHGKDLVCISYLRDSIGRCERVSLPNEFFSFVREVCKRHALPLLGETLHGTLTLDSDIPLGSGLGSSAALCCAIARLVLHYSGAVIDRGQAYQWEYYRRVWHVAHECEQFFHARASGIDTALCAFGLPLVLKPTPRAAAALPQFEPLPMAHGILAQLHHVYGYMPRERECAYTIATVQQGLRGARLHAFKADAAQAVRVLQDSAGPELCATLAPHVAHLQGHLRSLGASTPMLEEVLSCAQEHGACAAKLSGGGTGGAFVCLCSSAHTADCVARALVKAFASAFERGAFVARTWAYEF